MISFLIGDWTSECIYGRRESIILKANLDAVMIPEPEPCPAQHGRRHGAQGQQSTQPHGHHRAHRRRGHSRSIYRHRQAHHCGRQLAMRAFSLSIYKDGIAGQQQENLQSMGRQRH